MKKLGAFILLLIYFTVSTGVVVSLHYCMDRLDSVQVGEANNGKCGNCGMHKTKSHCCWDDVKIIKLETKHIASTASFLSHEVTPPQNLFNPVAEMPLTAICIGSQETAHGPPLSTLPLYLRNSVFRI